MQQFLKILRPYISFIRLMLEWFFLSDLHFKGAELKTLLALINVGEIVFTL